MGYKHRTHQESRVYNEGFIDGKKSVNKIKKELKELKDKLEIAKQVLRLECLCGGECVVCCAFYSGQHKCDHEEDCTIAFINDIKKNER